MFNLNLLMTDIRPKYCVSVPLRSTFTHIHLTLKGNFSIMSWSNGLVLNAGWVIRAESSTL